MDGNFGGVLGCDGGAAFGWGGDASAEFPRNYFGHGDGLDRRGGERGERHGEESRHRVDAHGDNEQRWDLLSAGVADRKLQRHGGEQWVQDGGGDRDSGGSFERAADGRDADSRRGGAEDRGVGRHAAASGIDQQHVGRNY